MAEWKWGKRGCVVALEAYLGMQQEAYRSGPQHSDVEIDDVVLWVMQNRGIAVEQRQGLCEVGYSTRQVNIEWADPEEYPRAG